MFFGAAYYPEHWPRERWKIDAGMMREAGFTMVRLGEFAWSRLEKTEGNYDFGWLDEIIGILGEQGIRVMLGTPTAAPPKWLADKYQGIFMVDDKGLERGFGSRRHYCYNNPDYRRHVVKIVEELAVHYTGNKQVHSWQIDNEFGNANTTRCYCDHCKKAFQGWLKEKYTDIGALNESWGTTFWSQTYNSWEEIIVPKQTSDYLHNPGTLLDFRRFSSDSAIAFQKLQTDILKRFATGQPVTHNAMGLFNQIDYYKLAEELDFVSLDNYPNMAADFENRAERSALNHDVTRGIKGMNYFVTEQQSGIPGGDILFPTPKPGELRKWTWQSVAHGADAILYFRWRSCLFGAEEFWHGILSHDGKSNRRYEEVKEVGEELGRVSELLKDTVVRAEVAILRSYDNEWAFELQPQIREYSITGHMEKFYGYFYGKNIPVDVISPERDFNDYKIIVMPNLMLSSDATAEKAAEFVKKGGTVVMDFRAGVKEWDNRVCERTLPGKFAELLGIEINDYGIIPRGQSVGIRLEGDPDAYCGNLWYDVIQLQEALPLGYYTQDYFSGTPAVTVNGFGSGKAYYIGTEPEEKLLKKLLERVCTGNGVQPLLGIEQKGIEIVRRTGEHKACYIVMNHCKERRTIWLDKAYEDVLAGRIVEGNVEIAGDGVVILKEIPMRSEKT